MEDSSWKYSKLVLLIFSQDENIIEDIIKKWIDNGLCEKEVDYDNDHNKQLPNNKKARSFYVDNTRLKEKNHIAYTFFKTILFLKPRFYIIGSTLYLFNNENLGVKTTMLKNDKLLDFYKKDIYDKRDVLFSKRSYPCARNILSGSKLSLIKIPIGVRFKILSLFHKLFVKSSFEVLGLMKKYPHFVKNNNSGKNIDIKTCYLVVNEFYKIYKNQLENINNECDKGIINLGVYESEKKTIKIILSAFINNINSNIK